MLVWEYVALQLSPDHRSAEIIIRPSYLAARTHQEALLSAAAEVAIQCGTAVVNSGRVNLEVRPFTPVSVAEDSTAIARAFMLAGNFHGVSRLLRFLEIVASGDEDCVSLSAWDSARIREVADEVGGFAKLREILNRYAHAV